MKNILILLVFVQFILGGSPAQGCPAVAQKVLTHSAFAVWRESPVGKQMLKNAEAGRNRQIRVELPRGSVWIEDYTLYLSWLFKSGMSPEDSRGFLKSCPNLINDHQSAHNWIAAKIFMETNFREFRDLDFNELTASKEGRSLLKKRVMDLVDLGLPTSKSK